MTPERWQQVGQLYQAALELEPEQRVAFLQHACGADHSLRREVESLLAADGLAGDFLDAGALQDAAQRLALAKSASLVGQRLGHYQVLSLLGAGGMGEVYLAQDTLLGRKVALKLLPKSFTQDAERVQRFKQEARAVSALNHPNIITIHEIGQAEGAFYIVTEFIEGQTLREQMTGARLSLTHALGVASQVAAALSAAHAAGIVHRDIKPENVMLRPDGLVKVLDFGLAKLKPPPSSPAVDTQAPTLKPLTGPGVVLGTVGYMAPEQVRGEQADHRTDIFAFGVMLYEMLAGRPAFQGNSAIETLNAILKEEPPELSEINAQVSPTLEKIVRRCLEKNPERRFQTASDLGFALEALSTPSGARLHTAVALPAAAEKAGKARLFGNARLAWLVAGLFLLATLAVSIVYLRQAPAEVQALRFSVLPPEKSRLGPIALSPDGRRLAFGATDAAGKTLLYLRLLDSLTAQPLAGTEGAGFPFWSPDSRFIGFFAQGKLKKIEATGGAPQALCNVTDARGGTWNRDGVIVFAPNPGEGLYRVLASGGAPVSLTKLEESRQELSHRHPQFLPDGHSFLYFIRSGTPGTRGIYVGSLEGLKTKRLLDTDSSAIYAPPGYLLYRREGALVAQTFDAQKRELKGEPFLLAEQVGGAIGLSQTFLTASENGVLAYHQGDTGRTQLAWFNRAGEQLGVIGAPGNFSHPVLSPDGSRIAFESSDSQTANVDLWLLELARLTSSRLTFDPAVDWFSVWSPDSSHLVFASNRGGVFDLYRKAASGAGSDELLLKSSHSKWPSDWSADGQFILNVSNDPKTKWDIWVLPLQGARQPFPLLQTEFNESEGRFSPNGKWLAYTSDESGTPQVYVQSFPVSGGKWPISTGGGSEPRWRHDGRELFYRAADGKLMAVEVKTEGAFQPSLPKPLFELHSRGGYQPAIGGVLFPINYAVTADGRRFLVRSGVETNTPALTVVVHWTAEVKR